MSAPRRQCAKCPWRKDVNPNLIPNNYSRELHEALKCTIAREVSPIFRELQVMACHETPIGAELPCVGWLVHQLGPGNNIGLRLRVSSGTIDANVETVGEQHERFTDTLPKLRAAGKRQ